MISTVAVDGRSVTFAYIKRGLLLAMHIYKITFTKLFTKLTALMKFGDEKLRLVKRNVRFFDTIHN